MLAIFFHDDSAEKAQRWGAIERITRHGRQEQRQLPELEPGLRERRDPVVEALRALLRRSARLLPRGGRGRLHGGRSPS